MKFTIRDLLWLTLAIGLGLTAYRIANHDAATQILLRDRETLLQNLKKRGARPPPSHTYYGYHYDEGWHAQRRGDSNNPYAGDLAKAWQQGWDDSRPVSRLDELTGR